MTIHYVSTAAELTAILTSASVLPGDEIQLLAGTYTASVAGTIAGSNAAGKGVFRVEVNGSAAARITLKPVPGARVRINGGLEIVASTGSYIKVQDLEIAPTPTARTSTTPDYPDCIYCNAPGCQFINNVLHDGREGISYLGAGAGDILDNVIYNVGWHDGIKWRGTGMYTHNHTGGAITIQHNAFHHAFGDDILSLWSASSNNVQDYTVSENVFTGARAGTTNSEVLCASVSGVVEENILDDNHLYHAYIHMGVVNANNGVNYLRNNRVLTGFIAHLMYYQNALTSTGNIFCNESQIIMSFYDGLGTVANTVDNNEYRGVDVNDGVYDYDLASTITWATWQGRGYDVNSTIETDFPTANETFVYELTNGNGLAVIWNWAEDDEVTITLPTSLSGASFIKARNTQDYYGDFQIQPVTAGQITLNMEAAARSVAPPEGTGISAPDTSFPTFGAFYLEATDPMGKNLFDLTYQTAKKLGPTLMHGKATGGSTTTLIDTATLTQGDDFWNGGTVWVLYDAGGSSAPPYGEYARVSDFVSSSKTATLLDALSASLAVGDQYAIAGPTFRLYDLIEAINEALRDLGDIAFVDVTSLETASAQTEYTLPFIEGHLTRVMVQGRTNDTNDNQWTPVENWRVGFGTTGSARTLYLPQLPAGRDLYLEYRGPHPRLNAYTDKLAETVPEQLVVTMAALYLTRQQIQNASVTDPRLEARRELLAQELADLRSQYTPERPQTGPQLFAFQNNTSRLPSTAQALWDTYLP